jgi:hypothetical protein
MINQRLDQYDYYRQPSYTVTEEPRRGHRPCPPQGGLQAQPAQPWEKSLAEHNLDKSAHPYLLSLFKNGTSQYFCKDTVKERDAIADSVRCLGLMVYVSETDTLYILRTGLTNLDWEELYLNTDHSVKIGRLNPPSNPENGTLYFDLGEERLKICVGGTWLTLPSQDDITAAISTHDSDVNAHAALFEDAENKWLTI